MVPFHASGDCDGLGKYTDRRRLENSCVSRVCREPPLRFPQLTFAPYLLLVSLRVALKAHYVARYACTRTASRDPKGAISGTSSPEGASESSPGRPALGQKSDNLTSPAGAQENTSFQGKLTVNAGPLVYSYLRGQPHDRAAKTGLSRARQGAGP